MTILVNSVNKQMLKRIWNDKQNAVTLNLFQGLVVRYFATLSMTGNILCHSEYCRLGLDPTNRHPELVSGSILKDTSLLSV